MAVAGTLVILPEHMADMFASRAAAWGVLDLRFDNAERIVAVAGFSDKKAVRLAYSGLFDRGHYLRRAEKVPAAGVWYRVNPELHAAWWFAKGRGVSITLEAFQERTLQGWVSPPSDGSRVTLAFSELDGQYVWTAWSLSTVTGAVPLDFTVVSDDVDPLRHLMPAWPADALRDASVGIIGVGSIGSSAAMSLAAAGVGHLTLVDPDRLLQHNLVRHQLTERDMGRFKVTAMRELLVERYPQLDVTALVADVAEDADLIRTHLPNWDIAIGATDGVQSRRVTNHLARRAGRPLILAAVLEDGAIGELIRVQPRTGCLWCLRRHLVESGSLDPEPGLDLAYGTGSPHRPMTAAPHDLRLMGELASKVTVATLLEASGRWTQQLPGDWATISLQAPYGLAAPFDVRGSGELRWQPLPPRDPECPSCAQA